MYIPIEIILLIVVPSIIFLFLRIKNLRYKIDFWRYAFISTSDEAYRLFKDIKDSAEIMIEDGNLKPEEIPYIILGEKRIKELCDNTKTQDESITSEDEEADEFILSAKEEYDKHIVYLLKLSKEYKINWVNEYDYAFLKR